MNKYNVTVSRLKLIGLFLLLAMTTYGQNTKTEAKEVFYKKPKLVEIGRAHV